jgi:hypothetical protein
MFALPGRQAWSLPEREVGPVIPVDPSAGAPALLNLEIRGAIEQSVTVSSLDAVSCLCPESGVTFLHRGRVLCPALSFGFLRVADGDQIFAVSKIRREEPLQRRSPAAPSAATIGRLRERFDAKFASRFRDPESVFEGMRAACDKTTAREAARLTDLFRARVDGSPTALRSLMGKISAAESARPAVAEFAATVLPEKAVTPSTELLPEIWSAATADSIA